MKNKIGGETCFHPGNRRDQGLVVTWENLRMIIANFKFMHHRALEWTGPRGIFSVYTNDDVIKFCHLFKVVGVENGHFLVQAREEAEYLAATKEYKDLNIKYDLHEMCAE